MIIRRYNESDYETLCKWWKEYNHVQIPKRYLSDTGFIVEDYVAVFVYETKSVMAWMEFMIGNPSKTKQERSDAISLILEEVSQYCKNNGYEVINTVAKVSSLQKKFEQQGYIGAENNDVKFMIKGVYQWHG